MKKNYTMVFAIVAVLIALCAFWGCSSSDDDDGPSLPNAEEAWLGDGEYSVVAGVQVYQADGSAYNPGTEKPVRPRNINRLGSSYATAVTSAGSKITSDGKLTLKLPDYTPYWNDYDGPEEDQFLTVNPSNTKFAHVEEFQVNNGEFRLTNSNTNGVNLITYMYADRDATITAAAVNIEEEGEPFYWNVHLKLKKGWNLVIETESDSGETLVTGTPGAGYRWTVSDD
jgi:hypothetical protein